MKNSTAGQSASRLLLNFDSSLFEPFFDVSPFTSVISVKAGKIFNSQNSSSIVDPVFSFLIKMCMLKHFKML